ncbi:MAG: hypothetical protein DWI27_01305 [Planctomycetota bacterium]|nr:MAG: hypothetical protein DWI27_01305 [Planctomycetota bacterium]
MPGCPHDLRQFWCDAKAMEQQAIERLKELFTQPVWNDYYPIGPWTMRHGGRVVRGAAVGELACGVLAC